MKLNNKGFTLVELLAVLVILIAISSIAIPTISSSLDRSKKKQYDSKVKLVVNAAELYVSDHRNNITGDCDIMVSDLIKDNYIEADDEIASDTCIKYTYNTNSYNYTSHASNCNSSNICGKKVYIK